MGAEAILLSAGESSRMGKPKALLDWFGMPLVTAQIHYLLQGGIDRVIVVTGAHHMQISNVVSAQENAVVVENRDWASGKTTSIKAGIAALSDECDTIVLLAVDQPRPAWVIARTLTSHRDAGRPVTSPRYAGHGGHPLIFDIQLLSELASITEENEGVREIMKRYERDMNRVYFDDPVVRIDLNTVEDYEAALLLQPRVSAQPTREEC